jgi:hypothetical protein
MVGTAGNNPADAEIENVLATVPPDRWEAIWSAWDEVAKDTEPLHWEGGEQVGVHVVDGVEKPVLQMPYAVYSPAVERLRGALGAIVVPFAWPQWEGVSRYRGGREVAAAPVADAVRLITAVLRSERFTDGSIAGAIEDGTLGAAVQRLRRWLDEQRQGRGQT